MLINTDERRAVLIIHKKYPEYELAYADMVDWIRKVGQRFDTPQKIADDFEKSEYFQNNQKRETEERKRTGKGEK